MEKNTLHRAADTINDLLKAHVSDNAEKVNVHDAMAVRTELREAAETLSDGESEYTLPEVGDVVFDPDSNPRFGDGHVEITEVLPNSEARTTYVEDSFGKRSVAYHNPSCDETAPVVRGKYVDGSDKVYSFPVDRLE